MIGTRPSEDPNLRLSIESIYVLGVVSFKALSTLGQV